MATPRLPIPGEDDGIWGEILNEYLSVSLENDGSLKQQALNGLVIDAAYVANAIQGKANTSDLSPVATSGAYNDLTGKPSVVLVDDARLTDTRTPTDNSVTSVKLQDESVTEPKLAVTNTASSGALLSWDGTALAWKTLDDAPVQSVNGKTGDVVLTKADVNLGAVDNTSDLDKPISTATQTALNAKANTSALSTVATSGSYNDLSDRPTLTKADIGLDAVDNTSDLAKPISTATQTALNAKANTSSLSAVATSGSYDDLSNTPTLPVAGVGPGTYAAGNDARITGALQASTVTAKGDLLAGVGSASLNRIPIGSNGQVLTADSTEVTGIKWSSLPQNSAINRVITLVSGNMNAEEAARTDYVYVLTGNFTLTLPTAANNTNMYTIKNRHNASVTVAAFGSETVDGGGLTLDQNESVCLISDGSNWIVT